MVKEDCRKAYMILTVFSIIMAIAVTSEVYNDGRVSDTYAKEEIAAEQENITKENTPADIKNLSLAMSQEVPRITENITPDMHHHIL